MIKKLQVQQATRMDGNDREIKSMQGTLSRHAGELSTLHQRSMQHSARLDQHEAGIDQLTDEFADLRRDYPRINPQRQGALLAASGAKALERGDLAEAARCFHLGKATNPIDPAMEYGLAVVMHRQNRDQEAYAAVARGIILEREHGAQKRTWFVADRFQGPDRHWLESLRRDPLYGVHTPGDLGMQRTSIDQHAGTIDSWNFDSTVFDKTDRYVMKNRSGVRYGNIAHRSA